MRSARLAEAIDRPVTLEELRHALERPITPEEREEVRALVTWFTRRYPGAEARLAYVRRAWRQWATPIR